MPDISTKAMYHLAPLIKLPETIDLPATSGPNTMYRLKPLVHVGGLSTQQAVTNGVSNGLDSESSGVVQQLSSRQEAVMQRLLKLQQQLDQLKAKQMADQKNNAAVSSAVTDVPQFKVLSSQQHAVVGGLNDLREHLVNMLHKQRVQALDSNFNCSISEAKTSEVTREQVHKEQQQLLERLQALRNHAIALRDGQALNGDSVWNCLAFDPIDTGTNSVGEGRCCKEDVTTVNSSLLDPTVVAGVEEHSYNDVAETHSSLLAILGKLREQVLQLPLLANNATNMAPTATSAVLEHQHQAVLHKLLLLQHRLSDVLLKQPGCPTWPPPGSEAGVCHDLVISACPLSPPYSVLAMAAALRAVGYTILTTAALHSSIDPNTVPLALSSEFSSSSARSNSRADHQVVLSFIWSAVPRVTLMVNPLAQCSISGEGNVLRYLSRLLPASSPYHYEADASFAAIARTDLVLDDCTAVLAAAPGDKKTVGQFVKRMDEALKKALQGAAVFGAVGDVAVWSALRQLQERGTKLPPASVKWINAVANTIVAGLLAGSRVRDASLHTPPVSVTSHTLEQQPGNSGIRHCNAKKQKDITNCISNDRNFSEGFWSCSRPIVSQKCNNMPKLESNIKRHSYSECRVTENTINHEEKLSLNTTKKLKLDLETEKESIQDDLDTGKESVEVKASVVGPSGCDEGGHVQYEGLVARIDQLGIKYQVRHHAGVMTVDQLMENVGDMPGLHMKNLFLRDKKKKTLYLVCARHNAKVQLNSLGKQVGCKELRFTDRDVLYSVLGVLPGHVTAYALINDVNKVVTLVLDEAVTLDKQQMVNFHPMVNTSTLGMSSRDLLSFIEFTGHKPLYMKFEDV